MNQFLRFGIFSGLIMFSVGSKADTLPCKESAQLVLKVAIARDQGMPVYDAIEKTKKIIKNADENTKDVFRQIIMYPYRFEYMTPKELANNFYLGCMEVKQEDKK